MEKISKGSSLTNTLGLGYRKLWQFNSGKSMATNIQLGYTNTRNESRSIAILELGTQLDYYFNKSWGAAIGLKLAGSNVRLHQSIGLDLSTEYFFTRQFSVNVKAQLEDYLRKSSAFISATKHFH